jgi:hypothetical protein
MAQRYRVRAGGSGAEVHRWPARPGSGPLNFGWVK